MKLSRLFKKTLALFIALFAAVAVTISAFSAVFIYDQVLEEHKSKALAIAKSISSTSLDILLNKDATTIQSLIDQLLEIESISYVFYESVDREIIAHTFVPQVPGSVLDMTAAGNHREPDESGDVPEHTFSTILIPGQGSFLDISAPILSGAAGSIHVGMDLQSVKDLIWATISKLLLLTLAIFACSAVAAYFMVNRISRPLNQLTGYANSLAAHDFSAKLEIETNDEVGVLARNMKTMGGELKTMITGLENAVENATADLQDTLNFLTVVVDNIADGLLVSDSTGNIIQFNPQICRMLALPVESCTAKEIAELLGPNFPESIKLVMETSGKDLSLLSLNRNTSIRNVDYEIRRADGTTFPVEISLSVIQTHKGTHQVAVIRDVTRRKQAEQEQQRIQELLEQKVRDRTAELSEANLMLKEEITGRRAIEQALASEKDLLTTTLRSIGDGVITTDINGRIIMMNPVAEKLTGWTQNAARGKEFTMAYRTMSPVPISAGMSRQESATLLEKEAVLRSLDGREIHVAQSVSPILDGHNQVRGAVIVFRDITRQKKMEEEHRKSEKLSSLGLLAGGIAHDFNNILTAVLNNIALARLRTSYDETVSQNLSKAETAVSRAQKLSNQLLTFSKGGAPIKEALSLEALVREAVDFTLQGSNVRCTAEIPEDLWPIEADRGQLVQVLDNLVINAVQSMPEGGEITVRARNVCIVEEAAIPLPSGNYVCIEVQDQGSGIPLENLDKIFDPYYTTKEQGSGLGLATTYSIIQNHHGHIEVESKVDVGTNFTLYLPALDHISCPDVPPADEEIVQGKGRILVMDDEASLRDLLKDALEFLGYTPVFARDGREALQLYGDAMQNNGTFDAVIMDLTIPGGMGGKEAIEKLMKMDPCSKVIVSSGYSQDPVMSRFRDYGFKEVLLKPYTIGEISTKLQNVLQG
ncbi:MAG: PAS domain S-box protein [Desulfovibrionales bacterium]